MGENIKRLSEFNLEFYILIIMDDLTLSVAVASSSVLLTLLAQYVIESFKHKNAVSKTVQDKLHLDRAEVIIEMYEKMIFCEQVVTTSRNKKLDEIDPFFQEVEECLCFFQKNSIYFEASLKRDIEEFSLVWMNVLCEVLEAKNLSSDQIQKLREEIAVMKDKFAVAFSILLGVE